jgi:phosphate transport system permease protein
VVTSLIAMAIGGAGGLRHRAVPDRALSSLLKRPIGVAVELLAAVPSIIFGIWGLFVLAPVLQRHVQPWLIEHFGHIPGVGKLFKGPPLASAF